jgi:hypothetical protein|nr:hypothetical protein [Neorhizobium tomejilense]
MNDIARADYVLWVAGVGNDTPGPGGWAAIVTVGATDHTYSVASAGDDYTTVAQTEAAAILAALARIPQRATVAVVVRADTIERLGPGAGSGEAGNALAALQAARDTCSKASICGWIDIDSFPPHHPNVMEARFLAGIAMGEIS